MLAVSFWSFFLYQTMNSQVEQRALWYSYLTHSGSIPIPALFLTFVFSILEQHQARRRMLMLIWGVTSLFLIFNYTPWFVSVAPSSGFNYFPCGGPIYPAFVIYFVIAASYGLWLLLRGYRQASGLKRNQLKYLLWSWLIGLSGGSVTFIPALGFEIPPWGFFSAYLITVGFMGHAYAIVKYRSMDINIVLRRGMVYSILLPSLTAGFLIILLGIEHLLRSYIGYSSLVATAIAALVLAVAFQPLKDKVQVWVDRVFFKGAYDYHKTLKETSEAMASILNLERLADHFLSSILADMRVTSGSLLLMHAKGTGLSLLAHRVHASHQKSEPPVFLRRESALVKTLEWDPEALMREGIRDDLASAERDEIVGEMAGLGADLAIPVTLQSRLLAILLLGPKLSGDPFSEEDLALLSTLANQAAVAIENARLYDEVTSIKEYLEHILRNLENGVITVDHEGRITTFNRAAEKMTQWKASEVLERDCRILEEKLAELLLSTLAGGEGRSGVELTLVNKEGKAIPIGATASLLRNQQGHLLGAIALFGDLTEVKELEKEKWKAEKLAYLGTLAASIAHEIKNPLVSIKTFAQLLPERHTDAEFRDHFSRIALKEVDRIDLLVSQMLDLKGNSHPPQFENLRVQEILEEILLLLSKQIEKQNIKVERIYQPGNLAVFGDRFQLKQALWNIILNAVQAMEGGGILTISTSLARDGKKSEGKVVLKISDTGSGIPGDVVGKIFDPFFTTKKKGTGLGLAICNKIIADHHGSVQVESQAQQGTCMVISFPAILS
jgi:PAS domain S-box-containing protein